MIQKAKLTYEQLIDKFQVKKPWDMIIIFVLNLLLTIPIFLIAHQNFIDLQWVLHLDRILLFITIIVLIQLVLRAMRRVTLISILLYLIILF